MYQSICGLFDIKNLGEMQKGFHNSKLRYGANAEAFYRDLRDLLANLQTLDLTIGEQGLWLQALQALPQKLKTVKFDLFGRMAKEFNYDNFVEEIIRKYDTAYTLSH